MAPLVNPRPNHRQDSVLLAASYLLSSLSGAGVALVLGFAEGSRPQTDGVLAAYSVYALAVLLAAIARTTLIPRFGSAADPEAYRQAASRVGSRAAALGVIAGLVLLVSAPATGTLLTAQLPDASQVPGVLTLVLLGPAVAMHAWGATASAILAGAHRFAASAAIYAAGGMATLLVAVPAIMVLGAIGAPVAVLIGSIAIGVAHEVRLRQLGVHLRPLSRGEGDSSLWRLGADLVSVSALQLAVQAGLTLAVANVAGAPGDVTRYTYAFFAGLTMVSITAGVSSMIRLPHLIARLDRGEPSAVPDYLRAAVVPSLAVVIPGLAALAAFGRPLLGLVFSGTFTDGEIDQLFVLCLLLSVLAPLFVVLFALQGVGSARQATRGLVTGALVGTVVTALGVFAVRGDTQAVATAHAATAAIFTLVTARAVLGPHAWPMLSGALRATWPAVLLALPFAAVGAMVGPEAGAEQAVAGAAICLAVYGVLGAWLWPGVLGRFPLLSRMARS